MKRVIFGWALLLLLAPVAFGGEVCSTNVQASACSGGGGSATGTVTGPAAACTDNAVTRWDGATTTVIQCSVPVISDAGAISGLTGVSTTSVTDSGLTSGRVTFASTAGLLADDADMTFATDTLTATKVVAPTSLTCPLIQTAAGAALAVNATAPAQTASAQAGVGTTITGSGAVAGSSNAGAAAGGNITFTAGAAARLTSGNANAGDYIFTGSAGIGTGTASKLVIPTGTAAAPSLTFTGDTNTGLYNTSAFHWTFITSNGTDHARFGNGGVQILTPVTFISSIGGAGGVSLSNPASGVLTTGAGGWLQMTPGRARNTADVTNNTTTFANLTDLTVTLIAGRKYIGYMEGVFADSTAAEGMKLDFNGGTATMTSFSSFANCTAATAPVVGTPNATTLAGVLNYTTITGETLCHVYISMVVNAAGTFIPRQAQNSHAAGTLTTRLGTYLLLEDSPN